jgi:hypothetical protein
MNYINLYKRECVRMCFCRRKNNKIVKKINLLKKTDRLPGSHLLAAQQKSQL